jgi:uncharacterized protein DUF3352
MKNSTPAVAILLLLIALTATASAQQKRQPTPKPAPKVAVPPAPAPTFETLVPADSYILYGEVRGAGQLIRSSAINDLLEPVLKLSGPPKEFRAIVRWLNTHAEEVMSSRLLVATWPNNKSKALPETLIAIEFASAEEAAKFSFTLNEFLSKVLLPSVPERAAENSLGPEAEKLRPPPAQPVPNFHLQRFGSLVVISPKPWTIKQLKPPGSKLLAEDTNFRAAYNRFNAEPLFVYVDTSTVAREEEESRKRWEQQSIEAKKQAEAEAESKKEEEPERIELAEEAKEITPEQLAVLQPAAPPEAKEAVDPDPFSSAMSALGWTLFSTRVESEWPDGVGFALSFEGDSFDLRALLVKQGGEKADAFPFLPLLITGPAFTAEAANIFPADTELLLTMSLDLPQIYTQVSKPRPQPEFFTSRGKVLVEKEVEAETPFTELEKRLKLSVKNDLLPLLGPEIAVRLPLNSTSMIGLPGLTPSPAAVKEQQPTDGPVLAIAVKDKEAIRALIPKLMDALGFKGASALAQTERREDTEIVSIANQFSYAFVGNFLVISGNPVSTRYVVDSYLKHETLAADVQFRNSTRWQPKSTQGQIYISPALMESYKAWAEKPTTRVSDQTRAFLLRASSVAQPITYSLSNEGLGPLHEVHIPKNLVLMAVAGISGEANPPQNLQNERAAISLMYTIASAESQYKLAKGSWGTLEQLIAADAVSKEAIENSGYKFELTLSGDKFEVAAVPQEYGKTGTLSLFIDQTLVLRGGDRNGGTATASDPPLR